MWPGVVKKRGGVGLRDAISACYIYVFGYFLFLYI